MGGVAQSRPPFSLPGLLKPTDKRRLGLDHRWRPSFVFENNVMLEADKLRVIFADDNAEVRELVKTILELDPRWELLLVSSGRECLRLAETLRPDVILLDVMMPEMDGLTAYKNLQAPPRTRDIPNVFLTGRLQASQMRQYSELGIRDLVAKHFDPLTLASWPRRAVDGYQAFDA